MYDDMTVTTKNIDAVAERMRAMLANHTYTVAHAYEYKGWRPEVRIHQQLEGSISYKPAGDGSHISVHHHNENHAQLIICDTYGVGDLSTTQTTDEYDPQFNAPYIEFDYNKIAITQRAPNRQLFHTLYVVED